MKLHPFAVWFNAHRDARPGKKARPSQPRLHADLTRAGAVGGLEVITCGFRGDPVTPRGRRIVVRQVLLVPPAKLGRFRRDPAVCDLPPAYKVNGMVKLAPLRVESAPSRCQVVNLVARTWRYPAEYLYCPPVRMLDLIAGRRLNCRFGILWGGRTARS
ncbi:MAG: hypothetical protein JWN86_1664 [Planctomycetota bacterium]|nr:hypothetical protein [Planctomycetota bacterium]